MKPTSDPHSCPVHAGAAVCLIQLLCMLQGWLKKRFDGMGEQIDGLFKEVR